MGIPNIDVIIYPSGPSTAIRELQYLELAPAASGLLPTCVVPLQIWIKNKTGSPIKLKQVAAEFSDPSLNKTVAVDVQASANGTNAWYATNNQYIVLPSPPPSPFTVKLFFEDFTEPWTDTVHFVPFPNTFNFPAKHADLGPAEFWMGKGFSHAGGGDQIFHHDLGILGFDPGLGKWTHLFPGTDGSQNAHHRVFNRPVHALADGVVTFYSNSVPDNPVPGTILPEGAAKGYGNAFNIRHGSYIGTYMHMRPGSLSQKLIEGFPEDTHFQNGVEVKAGEFLGLVGNSGTSSAPHLHVGLVLRDADKRQFSIPLPFSGAWMLGTSDLDPDNIAGSPWSPVQHQGLAWIPDSKVEGAVALAPFFRGRIDAAFEAAIDPLALILGANSQVYVRLTLPDPPPIDILIDQVREQIRTMGPEQRRRALERVRGLGEALRAVERELNETR